MFPPWAARAGTATGPAIEYKHLASHVPAAIRRPRGNGRDRERGLPGLDAWCDARRSAALYDLPDQEGFAAQALLRRLLSPEEVAAAVAWLCGPDASALTGAVLPIDAGLTA